LSFQLSPSILLQEVQLKLNQVEQKILNLESNLISVPEQIIGPVQSCRRPPGFGHRVCKTVQGVTNNSQISRAIKSNRPAKKQISLNNIELASLKNQERVLTNEAKLRKQRINESLQFQRETAFKLQQKEQPQQKQSNLPLIAGLGLIGVILFG